MTESYIQYAAGYQKDDIDLSDIEKAFKAIQEMDEEHGAFWVSIFKEDEEYVIEVNQELQLSIIFADEETKYQAKNLAEVKEFMVLLLKEDVEAIKLKIKQSTT